MKKLFASLVVAIAAMCFAPTAGATETATSSPQGLKYEAVVNQQDLSNAERAQDGFVIIDLGDVIIIITDDAIYIIY